MYYIVYKTVNKINGKYYIGVHKSKVLQDDYLGSGVHLKRAISKYGKGNFSRENLYVFDSEEEMFSKEKEIVNKELISDEFCYNLTEGGVGSWSHIDVSGENNPMHKSKGRSWKDGKTQEEIDEINMKKGSAGEKNGMFGKTHTAEARQKLSEANKKSYDEKFSKEVSDALKEKISKRFKGVEKTQSQKDKMSKAAKEVWKNRPIVQCPHCSKQGKGGAMTRFHFDNCKYKE